MVILITVGLPARGKSYISQKLLRSLTWLGYNVKVFNAGTFRRKLISLENLNVIIVDDVLFTGRSVRSCLDALVSFGRPNSVELLVLIDRRFSRELPIQPKYVGQSVDVIDNEHVVVNLEKDYSNVILLNEKQ